jgi:hypothetical protein
MRGDNQRHDSLCGSSPSRPAGNLNRERRERLEEFVGVEIEETEKRSRKMENEKWRMKNVKSGG